MADSTAPPPEGAPKPAPLPPPRRPLGRRVPPRPTLPAPEEGKRAASLQPVITVLALVVIGVHLVFGRSEFEAVPRLLFAIPGLLVLAEVYRNYQNAERRELPFSVLALVQFYVAFSFPSLIEKEFFDLNGPVIFTDATRLYGAIVVSGGSLAVYGGMRVGEWVGYNLRPKVISVCPPAELPSGFRSAVWGYLGVCVVFMMLLISARGLFPGSLLIIFDIMIACDVAIGLSLARPDLLRGGWSERLGMISFLVGAFMGLLRGLLDPAIRLGMVFLASRWSSTRKISITMIAALGFVYLLFQPVKRDFRARVWTSQEQIGYAERVDIWSVSFSRFWSKNDNEQEAVDSALDRVSELDPVLQAVQLVPTTIPHLEGQGWSRILTAPIPRFIWPDKPTTEDTDQRYAVTFNRQTDIGARTTAVLLPLLVDGYWNFGFAGVAVACGFVGLWAGICQRLWAGDHWALKTMAVAHLARLVVQGGLAGMYSGLFQHVSGLFVSCWLVYGLARLMSDRSARRAGQPLGFRRAQPRRAAVR